jgi:hypothetical protein
MLGSALNRLVEHQDLGQKRLRRSAQDPHLLARDLRNHIPGRANFGMQPRRPPMIPAIYDGPQAPSVIRGFVGGAALQQRRSGDLGI